MKKARIGSGVAHHSFCHDDFQTFYFQFSVSLSLHLCLASDKPTAAEWHKTKTLMTNWVSNTGQRDQEDDVRSTRSSHCEKRRQTVNIWLPLADMLLWVEMRHEELTLSCNSLFFCCTRILIWLSLYEKISSWRPLRHILLHYLMLNFQS